MGKVYSYFENIRESEEKKQQQQQQKLYIKIKKQKKLFIS